MFILVITSHKDSKFDLPLQGQAPLTLLLVAELIEIVQCTRT